MSAPPATRLGRLEALRCVADALAGGAVGDNGRFVADVLRRVLDGDTLGEAAGLDDRKCGGLTFKTRAAIETRNAALIAAAEIVGGESIRATASNVVKKLTEYQASAAWKRDRCSPFCLYPDKSLEAHLWRALTAWRRVPGVDHIRRLLAENGGASVPTTDAPRAKAG